MSTAALAGPHVEVTAPDTMDLHTDSGLDFGDGDIDLDLPSTGGLDDDVSLRDAATDNGLDAQAMSGDQDDFMADNEDLIEEDVAEEDVEVDIELQPEEDTTNEQADPAVQAAPEEDLIDYSDDDEAEVDETAAVADVHDNDNVDTTVAATQSEEVLLANDTDASSVRGEGETGEGETASLHATYPYEGQSDEDDEGGSTVVEDPSLHATQRSSDQAASPERDQVQNEVKPDVQPSSKDDATAPELSASDPKVNPPDAVNAAGLPTEENGQVSQEVSLHRITVNYDGAELWLFKRHDYDDSGDYLLDDDSFLTQPVSALLDACREALRADVSDDLELGIRLDSLHGIDLYSEHSSCYFVKLSDLVHVYLQLHAQDGITEPESFYITILSRPRVSSLFTELVKAAAAGMGHSGLNDAIAAGQTCFNARFTHNSTEQVYGDWDEDEEEEEEPTAENKVEHGEQDEDEEGYYGGNEGEHNHDDEEKENSEEQHQEEHIEQALEGTADDSQAKGTAATTASDEKSTEKVESRTNEHAEQSVGNDATSDQHNQGPQEDLIDYSDDDNDDQAPSSQVQVTRSSTASATVQGDDPPHTLDTHEDATQNEQQSEQNDVAQETTHDGSADIGHEHFGEYEGVRDYSYEEYSYEEFDGQNYGEAFDGEYEQDHDEGQELEGYPTYDASQDPDETTNYLDDLGQHSAAPVNVLSVAAGPDTDKPDAVNDSRRAPSDFLGFDDTAATAQTWEKDHAAEDEIEFSDDEDGAASQTPVAASTAADTVATSSSGPQNLSPQGQKRTIDEVGNDAVDATTSTDAKRPRV